MEKKDLSQDYTRPLELSSDESTSFDSSRRRLLQGAVAATAGLSLAGVAGVSLASALSNTTSVNHTQSQATAGQLKLFFSILATGEALAQTFYSNALAHARDLRLSHEVFTTLGAIRAEEQLHFRLALSEGGTPATTHFSFPHGAATFRNPSLFLQTQQQIEELTSGALLAWINDTASMGLSRVAQLGGQLMQVEGGHRVLGRVLMGADPFADWGFAPVVVEHFSDVPNVVKAAGFLSPRSGNDFELRQIDPRFPGLINTTPGKL
ncbi:MAG: hypothetical protein JO011_01545 [Ktedonobacteraceae bacterium]|nr:hypothetical protein [Ktedonobacteraceae bacterium]